MIVTGCKAGIPRRAGIVTQCTKAVAATIVVTAKQGQRHGLEVCNEHFAELITRKELTEYTESATGQGVPLRVKLV